MEGRAIRNCHLDWNSKLVIDTIELEISCERKYILVDLAFESEPLRVFRVLLPEAKLPAHFSTMLVYCLF